MTHREWIESEFEVLASTEKSILFREYNGDLCCEINGQPFDCRSIEEFYELIEFFGEEEDFAI